MVFETLDKHPEIPRDRLTGLALMLLGITLFRHTRPDLTDEQIREGLLGFHTILEAYRKEMTRHGGD